VCVCACTCAYEREGEKGERRQSESDKEVSKPNSLHAMFTFLSERDKAILLRLFLLCAFMAWRSLSPVRVRRRRFAPLDKKPEKKK
jgi:hypothetical protein